MEKYEKLSNKELHAKILEYGLPNIPVTDSNRNVLIKRIMKTVDEEKKSKRRQTVAAVSTSSRSNSASRSAAAVGNNVTKLNYEISVPDTPPKPAGKRQSTGKTPAVAISEELLALSNKEIQKLCREYEMENIPVTDSNRNILCRRLQTAMDEVNKNETSKRRHTIQPTATVSSSVAATKSITFAEPRPVDKAHVSRTNVRRTVTSAVDASPSPSPRRSDVGKYDRVDSSTNVSRNQYVAPVVHEEKRSYLPPLYSEDASRRDRSVSLSKTGVLTTSYLQESSPLSEHMEIDDEEPEDDSADYGLDSSFGSNTYSPPPNYSQSNYNRNSTYNSFSQPAEAYVTPSSYSSNYSAASAKPFNDFVKPREVKTASSYDAMNYSSKPAAQASLSSSLSSTRYSNLYPKLDSLANDNLNKRNYTSLGASQTTTTSFASPRYSNTNYQTASASRLSPRNSYAAPEEDDEPYDDEPEAEEFSSDDQFDHRQPQQAYLSKYSPSSVLNRRSLGRSSTTAAASTGIYEGPKKRISTTMTKSSSFEEDSPFKQFLVAMDRKYHLRQALLLISIFVLSVFVYVFFIQP